jgi:hypothetical protein
MTTPSQRRAIERLARRPTLVVGRILPADRVPLWVRRQAEGLANLRPWPGLGWIGEDGCGSTRAITYESRT